MRSEMTGENVGIHACGGGSVRIDQQRAVPPGANVIER